MLRPSPASEAKPLAIAARFLAQHRVYQTDFDGRSLVVITTSAGANRVYEAGGHTFARGRDDDLVTDDGGHAWKVGEDAIREEGDSRQQLVRVPAHRAFWFGWFAQHPDTQLVR